MTEYCAGLLFLALLTAEDIRDKRISLYKLLLFGAAAVLYLMVLKQPGWQTVIGGLLPGGLLLLLAFFTRESIGYGDGAAVAVLGLWTGGWFALKAAMAGIMLAGVWGMIMILRKKRELIPFMPFLLLGMEVALVYA